MPINGYWMQLTDKQIDAGMHRQFVGGMWDEIGKLQADYLVSLGLKPQHRLLDMGCGSLRGGLHFMRYLNAGNYFGVDINASLVEAGRREIDEAGLQDRRANLTISNDFDASKWGVTFDYGIALSLFTHLTHDLINRCLSQINEVMAGPFYATYFEAPSDTHRDDIRHSVGGIETHYERDPYHISFGELSRLARNAGMDAERIGAWGHPRSQYMAAFRRK